MFFVKNNEFVLHANSKAVGNVLGYENDCLDAASGNYRTRQSYGYDNLYQLIKVSGATTYNPYRSAVPEFKSDYSQAFEFDADGLGNMTGKISTETVSPQKTIGDNLNYQFDYVYDENYAHRLVSAGERYYQYDENGNVVLKQDAPAPKAQSSITSSNANDGQAQRTAASRTMGTSLSHTTKSCRRPRTFTPRTTDEACSRTRTARSSTVEGSLSAVMRRRTATAYNRHSEEIDGQNTLFPCEKLLVSH